MTYLNTSGIQIPTALELLKRMEDTLHANVSPLLDTGAQSPDGQILRSFAIELRYAWEAIKISYESLDPEDASGRQLEAVSAITGTTRAAPTRSRFTGDHALVVHLDATTTVPAGTRFTTPLGTKVFEATESKTSTIAGNYLLEAQCLDVGPVQLIAHTLTVVVTNVSGLNSVDNPYDATLGTNEDTDPGLRVRRQNELADLGACNLDALRAALLAYRTEQLEAPVTSVTVTENTSEFFVNSLPPKSFEALVFDGLSPTVADEIIGGIIWANKPAGVQAYGATAVAITDEAGDEHEIRFSRPSSVDVKLAITLIIHAATYAGDALVKAALLARFAARVAVGDDVTAADYPAVVLVFAKGVVDVTNIQLGRVGSSYNLDGANLSIGAREYAQLSSGDIEITTVEDS